MPRLESTKRLLRRWFVYLPLSLLLGLVIGAAIAVPLISRPVIAIIPISGVIVDQAYTDNILKALRQAGDDGKIKAVVLQIDSPGGYVVTIEQIYLDVLRLRQEKPVVVSIGTTAASGGYYIAVAANYIYAVPTSEVGSVGAWSSLPEPERLDEDTLTTGRFKAAGSSRRKAMLHLEIIRQEFVDVVVTQRGDRLKLSEDELSLAEVYLGVEGLHYGLIDDIGTSTDAIAKAASLAGVRNYEVVELDVAPPDVDSLFFGMDDLKSQTALLPVYYFLYFESE